MNNSDHNDFDQWQNGDYEDNNPNNYPPFDAWKFYRFPKSSEAFKKMMENMNKNDGLEDLANYLNLNEIMKENMKQDLNRKSSRKSNKKSTVVNFTQDEYMKLIEIRGYLAITEQFAHVKALDKVLNQIKMIPMPPKQKD
jgi:hypothetical protein